MKRMKRALWRSIPVFLIALVMVVMSVVVYNDMIRKEMDKCWEWLSVTTRTMAEKVQMRFDSSLTLLDQIADGVLLKVNTEGRDDVLAYLTRVQESKGVVFDRLDVLLPDNTLILQTGEQRDYSGERPFKELVALGSHVSPRTTDRITGREVIYCAVPVTKDGQAEAVLIGMVDCMNLPAYFPSYSYGGQAQIFLVDRRDGAYLMDRWDQQLGNADELNRYKLLSAYEDVDIRRALVYGQDGKAAFYGMDGEENYMYYRPVEGYPWTVAMAVQGEHIFADVETLRETLLAVGVVALVMLAFYVSWNVIISVRLIGHEDEVRSLAMERAANEAKSTFLSTMSHDIRTPLNGIVGMLEMIQRRGGVPEHIQDCLKKIDISTQYLMTLADDVLEMTVIESSSIHLSDDAIDLNSFAEELNVLVQPKVQEAQVSYSMDVNVKHPHVKGSAIHMRRIMINLITNAVKYNKKNGSVRVSIEEVSAEDGVGRYRFTVQDTGLGMSREFQQRMFNSFSQENSGARSTHKGHGLGLSIVHKLVLKMNGEIRVASEKGEGSVFVVTLPLTIDAAPRKEVEAPLDSETKLTGIKVLLVEDNELNVEIARFLLEEAGAAVTVAGNGQQAVETFSGSREGDFDVILMDVMMPEMDGLEATRVIRKLHRPDAKRIPIIAMTANTFAEDVRKCRDAGMDEHVGKPIAVAELIGKINRCRFHARAERETI